MSNSPEQAPSGFIEIKIDDAIIFLRPTLEAVAEAKGLLGVYERKLKNREKAEKKN